MLKPLFNRNCELIGWLKTDEHIFSTSMEWIAYIKNGNAKPQIALKQSL